MYRQRSYSNLHHNLEQEEKSVDMNDHSSELEGGQRNDHDSDWSEINEVF